MLDKKVIRKSIIIILIILLIILGISLIRSVFSRYESEGKSSSDVDMALWIVNESFVSEDLYLGEIEPASNSDSILLADNPGANYESIDSKHLKQIKFSIQNYNEGENGLVASVPLKYEIKLTATTNMPLEYCLYQYTDDRVLNTTKCNLTTEIVTDDDGTCYKQMTALPVKETPNDFFLDSVAGVTDRKEKDEFLLLVWFPDKENDVASDDQDNNVFADKIEHLKLEINAEQMVKEEPVISE